MAFVMLLLLLSTVARSWAVRWEEGRSEVRTRDKIHRAKVEISFPSSSSRISSHLSFTHPLLLSPRSWECRSVFSFSSLPYPRTFSSDELVITTRAELSKTRSDSNNCWQRYSFHIYTSPTLSNMCGSRPRPLFHLITIILIALSTSGKLTIILQTLRKTFQNFSLSLSGNLFPC